MSVSLSPENVQRYDDFALLTQEYQENWDRANEAYSGYWALADRDLRAYAGSTWTRKELNALKLEQREPIELPIIRSKVNWFTGYQRDNVKSVWFDGTHNGDDKTADQRTKAFKSIWYRGQGQFHFNQAFSDSCKTGLELFGLYLDFTKDKVSGDIKYYKRGYNSFVLDPDFKNLDLSDCAWAVLRDVVTRDQAKGLLPFIDPSVIDDVPSASRDNKFLYLKPFYREFNCRDIIIYDQYYRRVTKNIEIMVDVDTGAFRDITDLSKDARKRLKEGLKELSESGDVNVEIRKETKEIIELCVFLSGEPVWKGKDPTGIETHYPFVPIVCHYEPSMWEPSLKFQGIVRSMYDAQRVFNKRHMKILNIMDTMISSGFKYQLGAIDDPKQLLQSGQSRIVAIQPGYGLDSVQELGSGNPNIGQILQYSEVMKDLFSELSAVNETMTGFDEGGNTQISGRLAQVRLANGVRANRAIFDNLEFSQKLATEITMEAIIANSTPEKIAKILGEEPTPEFFSGEFSMYDVELSLGVESQSQQDQYYFELVNLKRDGIVDVPQSEIIKALPMTGKSDLEEAIKAQEQAQAQFKQEQQELSEMQKELVESQTQRNLAAANEDNTRSLSNIGLEKERASQSIENTADAGLARAKTLSEIQTMTTDQILKALQFVKQLEKDDQDNRERKEADITMEANQIKQQTSQGHSMARQAQEEKGQVQAQGNDMLAQLGGLDG